MVGFVVGLVVAGILVYILMPKMMLLTKESRFDYHTTINKIEDAIADQQWSHKGTTHIADEIREKTNSDFNGKIGIIKLCKADYAYQVLEADKDRFVSSLMPCGISVWEAQDGKVYVSKMNTGLMGKMFGGVIASVMGGHVAKDEKKILSAVIKD